MPEWQATGLVLLYPADLGENSELGLLPSPSSWIPFSAEPPRHSSLEIYSSVGFQGNRRALLPPNYLLAWPSIWHSMKAITWGACWGCQKTLHQRGGQGPVCLRCPPCAGRKRTLGGVTLTVGGRESKTKRCLKQETRNWYDPVNYITVVMKSGGASLERLGR